MARTAKSNNHDLNGEGKAIVRAIESRFLVFEQKFKDSLAEQRRFNDYIIKKFEKQEVTSCQDHENRLRNIEVVVSGDKVQDHEDRLREVEAITISVKNFRISLTVILAIFTIVNVVVKIIV